MNRQEAAEVLRRRNLRWPNTPVVDVGSEVDIWSLELAVFPVELVQKVLDAHTGGFALTIGEVREQCRARTPRPSAGVPSPAERACPTCGRSPFGPHRGQDPCRTCGRDDAPEYARIPIRELEATNG